MGNKLCGGLVAAMAGRYLLRRQGLRWGATDEEVQKPLPGDEVVPHPMVETTHALILRASASEVWPWLVQIDYYRAGWYTDLSWWDKPVDEYLKSLVRKEAEESGMGHRAALLVQLQTEPLTLCDEVLRAEGKPHHPGDDALVEQSPCQGA